MSKRITKALWKKFRQENAVGQDCQLITVTNAHTYWTGQVVSPEEYEELVDLTGCRYGTANGIQAALDRFGLEFVEEPVWPSFMGTKDLPCEINVWHKRYGSHSVLAVDLCAKTEAVRLLNFDYLTTAEGWMFLEDLHHFECKNPNRKEPRWSGRTIRLRESSGSGTIS